MSFKYENMIMVEWIVNLIRLINVLWALLYGSFSIKKKVSHIFQ